MDPLVLIRVRDVLDRTLFGASLAEVHDERDERFRLVFESRGGRVCVVLSVRPELPWIGRVHVRRQEGPGRSLGSFASACARSLTGSVLARIDKPGPDRRIVFEFRDGHSLVAELATHGANLVLLAAENRILCSARHPRRDHSRLEPGRTYSPPPFPTGCFAPHGRPAAEVDAFVRERLREGEGLLDVLRRHLFGIGPAAARLVAAEAVECARSPATVLVERLAALERGEFDPVIDCPCEDPIAGADSGEIEAASLSLYPWPPTDSVPRKGLVQGRDAAETTGIFHEAVERCLWRKRRAEAYLRILQGEVQRLGCAEERIERDLVAFEDPDRFRRWGEALLAGLSRARRVGNHVLVPDPYDAEGKETSIPARAGLSLAVAAEGHFRSFRRSRRGLEAARRRLEGIRGRRELLQGIASRHQELREGRDEELLLDEMRRAGLPVGLEPPTQAGRNAARRSRPRLEGVRLFTSRDGIQILVGKTGRDNDRLTFRLAGPEDFWLHARGVPGAHVVVRNPRREPRPPRGTLEEAAAIAAWYSDARDEGLVDVQWTRRRNVHRLRGAPPGTVTLKRSETVRARPSIPSGEELREEPRG